MCDSYVISLVSSFLKIPMTKRLGNMGASCLIIISEGINLLERTDFLDPKNCSFSSIHSRLMYLWKLSIRLMNIGIMCTLLSQEGDLLKDERNSVIGRGTLLIDAIHVFKIIINNSCDSFFETGSNFCSSI